MSEATARYFTKSPTRVDLAGGTLDMWPLFNFVGGSTTINLAIDIWTTAEIKTRTDRVVLIKSPDLKREWQFKDIAEFFDARDADLNFYKIIFTQFKDGFFSLGHGFEITTTSQSPIGGGLGGSSSLTISILKSVHSLLEMPLPFTHDLVHLAHNLESEMLMTPTGTQDYYPAVTGGLSFIDYQTQNIQQTVSSIDDSPFLDHFLLVYTGRSHKSGLNNFEVLKSAVEGDVNVLDALKEIKIAAEELKAVIQNKNWTAIPELFRREFAARIRLTPAFTSPEIEKLAEICLAAGALAVKICGAGGGGCVMVWVSPQMRERVVSACQKENFQCLTARPVNPL